MTFILLVLKEWKLSLVAVLSTLLAISVIFGLHSSSEKAQVEAEFKTYTQEIEHQNLLAANMQKQREVKLLAKQNEIEVLHNAEIKKLQTDVANATAASHSLSEQLTKAKSRIPTADITATRVYAQTVTELFRNCTAEYTEMGIRADEHRVNEDRAIDLYNSLVDELNHNNKNK